MINLIDESFKVLDKGFISLQAMSPHPQQVEHLFQTITNSARTSYLGDSKGYENDLKLLKYLYKNGHHTPFEMVDFTFKVKAPIFVIRQWMRHRMASYNEQSARYTEFDGDYYVPEHFRNQDTINRQGSSGEHQFSEYYKQQYIDAHEHCLALYNSMIKDGIGKEMARLHLPVSMYSVFIYKTNLRSLMNFINLRCDEHAQHEIRQYALVIRDIINEIAPEIYNLIKENNG